LSEQYPWLKEGELLVDSKNLEVQEIIHLSEWKKTASLLVSKRDTESRYLVKFCSSESPETIREKFLKEVEFYRSYDGCCVPAVIDCGDQFVILKYIESVTLREWLDRYLARRDEDTPGREFVKLLGNLEQRLSGFYINGGGKDPTAAPAMSLIDRLNNLLGSGPLGTTRSSLEMRTSRFMRRASARMLKWVMCRLESKLRHGNYNLWSPHIHMDLHGNNLLVDTDNGVFIIDFENVQKGGLWLTDTVYLYAVLMAGLHRYPAHQECLDKHFMSLVRNKDPGLTSYWSQLSDLFTRAALTNSRFRNGDGRFMPGFYFQYTWGLTKMALDLLRS